MHKSGKSYIIAVLICSSIIYKPAVFYSQVGYSRNVFLIMSQTSGQNLSKTDRELSGDTSVIINNQADTILSRNFTSHYREFAAQYILNKFLSFGYDARYMIYRSTGKNVIAVKTGTKYPNQKYIITSHYDDMPIGDLAPGADDNASGCSAVLEAARILAPLSFDYTLEFVTFDEEELGLIGSHAFVDSAYANSDSILGVFNMDMIAYDGNNDYHMEFRTDTNSLPLIAQASGVFTLYQPQFVQTININLTPNADNTSFWTRGYKAILCIENTLDFNPYYHTVNDNFSHVNMNFFTGMTQAAIAWFMSAGWDYFVTFRHTPIVSSLPNTPSDAVVEIDMHKSIAAGQNAPRLYYSVNNSTYSYVNSYYRNLDTFKFSIPGQPNGSEVKYYFAAQDSAGEFVGTYPLGGKGENPPGTIPPDSVFRYSVLTGIAPNSVPVKTSLAQNYPNPFNPSTRINFSVERRSAVQLKVYDMLGREIEVLVNGNFNSGDYSADFDGSTFASGMYFYTLFIDGARFDTRKMILIK